MAATETITSIILIKLIRVSLGTVMHRRRFKIVVIDIQITLKQMLSDFIAIRDNRAKKSGMVNITSIFFQAEDGIRDSSVNGVQTCALPILQIFLQRRIKWHDGGNLFDAEGRFVRGLRRKQSRYATARAARLPESAREVDLVRRGGGGVRSEERRVGKEGRSRWSPYH